MNTRTILAAGAAITALSSAAALAGTVTDDSFDQVSQIVALGGTVTQVGGGNPGGNMTGAGDFVGTPGALTGVSVTLPGWAFGFGTTVVDAAPTQAGNIAGVLDGAPTDLTFTTPGAGGPDGTAGDGSFSVSSGDVITSSFPLTASTIGVDTDLFIFTNTDGAGSITIEILLNGAIVDTIIPTPTPATSGGAGTAIGGVLIDIADGLNYNSIRITGGTNFAEIDGTAVRAIPLPTTAGLASLALLAGGAGMRRRAR